MMKEKILSQLKTIKEGKNLANLSEITIEKYAEAISKEFTEETELNENFDNKHIAILETINGQLYADNKRSTMQGIEEYKKTLEKQATTSTAASETKLASNGQPSENDELTALRAKIEAIEKKEQEREEQNAKKTLIETIKQKCDEKNRAKFATYVDTAMVDFDADADTNYDSLYATFEKISKPDVDSGSVHTPNGQSNATNREKFADVFKGKQ